MPLPLQPSICYSTFYVRMRSCASFGFGGVAVVKRRSHEAVDCFEPLRHFLHGWMIVGERRTEALDLVGTIAARRHAHIVSVQQDIARTSPHLAALYTPPQWSRRSCARVPSIFRTARSGRRARRHLPRFASCCSFPIGSCACFPASSQSNDELLSHCWGNKGERAAKKPQHRSQRTAGGSPKPDTMQRESLQLFRQ